MGLAAAIGAVVVTGAVVASVALVAVPTGTAEAIGAVGRGITVAGTVIIITITTTTTVTSLLAQPSTLIMAMIITEAAAIAIASIIIAPDIAASIGAITVTIEEASCGEAVDSLAILIVYLVKCGQIRRAVCRIVLFPSTGFRGAWTLLCDLSASYVNNFI